MASEQVVTGAGGADGIVRYRTFIADSQRWCDFEHRPGDIVISTPPKSGTTWTQMLCALLVFDTAEFPAPLSVLSPWLDMNTRSTDEVFDLLGSQTHRRFIKTHTPLDGMPLHDDVTYLVVGRDPRDVMISWEHHIANVDIDQILQVRFAAVGMDDLDEIDPPTEPSDDPRQRFVDFVDDDREPTRTTVSLRSILHHLDTGWARRDRPNVALFHFHDYQTDLVGEMERLASVLGIDVPRSRLAHLGAEADLERMRARADDVAPDAVHHLWKDTSAFFRSGASGEWVERLHPGDAEHYEARVAELAARDLAAWAHQGWLASGLTRPD